MTLVAKCLVSVQVKPYELFHAIVARIDNVRLLSAAIPYVKALEVRVLE